MIALLLHVLLMIFHWTYMLVFLIRREQGTWAIIVLIFNIVGSSLAYLVFRSHFSSDRQTNERKDSGGPGEEEGKSRVGK